MAFPLLSTSKEQDPLIYRTNLSVKSKKCHINSGSIEYGGNKKRFADAIRKKISSLYDIKSLDTFRVKSLRDDGERDFVAKNVIFKKKGGIILG